MDEVEIFFKNEYIGKAKITSIDLVKVKELTDEDAERGGFRHSTELVRVLEGFFRFTKDLGNHEVYKIQFEWI